MNYKNEETMPDTDLQWMSGAIPTTGVKAELPASTTPLGERKQIKEYFERISTMPLDQSFPSPRGHAPHACSQCENIVIDSEALAEPTLVLISDSLEAAVEHAKKGCLFFRWLLSLLMKKDGSTVQPGGLFQGDTYAEIRFFLRFNPTWKQGMSMNFGVWVELTNVDGEFSLEILRDGHLHACATEDDAAAPYIPSRPHEPDKASQKSNLFVRDSLEDCLKNHPKCRLTPTNEAASGTERIPPNDLPTRLLHIESNGHIIKLVTVNELDDYSKSTISQCGYASLSYCWGGPQPLCLTSHTIQALAQGIEASILPRTLQDAVKSSTLCLGFEYIWIDALCIKQDDAADKQLEIARMPLYYGRNTVTISAASAATCTEGFLSPSSFNTASAFKAGPFSLSFSTPKQEIGKMQLSQAAETPPEPIASRGWTYQESLLSRRLVIYGSRQVYWTCNTSSGSYGGADAKADSKYNTVDTRLLGTSQNLARILQYPWRDAWVEVVREFMTRTLGVESDKLLAISALAARMADEARERGMCVTYLAGLFVNDAGSESNVINWADQLLWYVDSSSPGSSRRPGTYRAPSWSWASADASEWGSLRALLPLPWDVKKYDFDFKVAGFKVEHTHPATAPYGSVESAFLIVQGCAKHLDGNIRLDGAITCSFPPCHSYRLAESKRTGADLLLFGDTTADTELIRSVIEGRITDEVYLLELVPPFLPRRSPSVGLVLEENSDESMSRIGVYVFYSEKIEILEAFYDGIIEDCRLI